MVSSLGSYLAFSSICMWRNWKSSSKTTTSARRKSLLLRPRSSSRPLWPASLNTAWRAALKQFRIRRLGGIVLDYLASRSGWMPIDFKTGVLEAIRHGTAHAAGSAIPSSYCYGGNTIFGTLEERYER